MPLLFTGTWEHALLTVTAQAVAVHPNSGTLSRGSYQRILYMFLQIAGVPMRYSFDVQPEGGFCDRILHDIDRLLADEVLKDDAPPAEKYRSYRPGPCAEELLQSHAELLEKHRATIDRVVNCLLPLQRDHLDLVNLLHYLFRWIKAGGGEGPWKDRVIERFLHLNKEKYTPDAVSADYDAMVRAKLLEA